ncbi:TRAP transporter substrate-binding protein [Chryseomicrobium palamuruense]|uniref:TRAP transporter substrate-binding protein n=1 Tax=Chryseomicrobium palamuruense TaxID=682973 RepID=A0ABV8USM4_9BACL
MLKKVAGGLFVTGLALSLAACGGDENNASSASQGETSGEVTTLRLGHIASETDAWHLGAQKFAELVEEKTDGSVKVELYASSTLGNDRDLIEGMQLGSIDFALVAGVLSNFYEPYSILELPYLFEDTDHLEAVLYGEVGEQLQADLLENADIRGLDFWVRGPRLLTASREIQSASELSGLKIRVPEIPASIAAWEAMGATPTPMAFGEVYSSLQTGVIDAQENPLALIESNKLNEVQDYLMMTNHVYGYVQLTMSEQTYQKLSADQQAAIEEAAEEATQYENELVYELEAELLQKLKDAGMTVVEPDIASFSELATTVHAEFADESDAHRALYDSIVNAK